MDTQRQYHYLLVEDEAPAVRRFQNLIKLNGRFIQHDVAATGKDAIARLKDHKVDVLFLDIELPDMSGFELLDHLPDDQRPLLVFITAYDKYALPAFDYFAIDYLLKPFSNDRFRKMIARIESQLPDNPSQNSRGLTDAIRKGDLPGKIVIRTGKKHHFISIEEITWIAADGNYCDIHLYNGNVHVHRETISRMTEMLPKTEFIRIHHSYIVRAGFVKSVNRVLFGDMEVLLKDNTQLKVSRSYKKIVQDLLK